MYTICMYTTGSYPISGQSMWEAAYVYRNRQEDQTEGANEGNKHFKKPIRHDYLASPFSIPFHSMSCH